MELKEIIEVKKYHFILEVDKKEIQIEAIKQDLPIERIIRNKVEEILEEKKLFNLKLDNKSVVSLNIMKYGILDKEYSFFINEILSGCFKLELK